MARPLESAEELTSAMGALPQADALAWFADWLVRRDSIHDEITADELVAALEGLAAELRGEARNSSNGKRAGLRLAAGYLTDTAADVRCGDRLQNDGSSGLKPLSEPAEMVP